MSDKYNGWANWETWNLNLHMDDGEEFERIVGAVGNVSDGAEAIEQYVYEWLDTLMFDCKGLEGTIFYDFITASLHAVDWREIAEHHKPDEWGDSDEAPGDEDDDEDDE
jgi:hypothetical protein